MQSKRLLLPSVILLLFGLLAVATVHPIIDSMESSWAKVIPTIDGSFDENEWADATHLSFYHSTPIAPHDPDYVHIYIKNTDSKLYLLFDDLPDDTEEAMDHLWVFFDANLDNIVDDNLTMFLDRDHNPGSALAGNDFAQWVIGFETSPNKATAHSIMEVAISISFESIYDGSSIAAELNNILPVGTVNNEIKLMFSAADYFCGWEIPETGEPIDAGTFGTLTFDISPPLKPYAIVLIVIGGIVVTVAIIGGIIVIIKKR
jgi:hypothetical protein